MAPDMNEHLTFIKYEYPEYRIFIISPVGSWNYDCADEHSDVDTKCIVIPSVDDIIQNKCESYTHMLPNQEHCDVADIRNFMKSIQKGNPQFIEVLFSKWSYFNSPYYGQEIHDLFKMREDIARCNPQNTMRAMLGMADRNFNLCQQRYDEPHASKWLYQLVRIEEQMKKYMLGDKFADCLVTNQREDLLYIKNEQWSEREIKAIAHNAMTQCTSHYNVFKDLPDTHEDMWTQMRVQQIVTEVCKKSINEVTR